MVLWFGGRARIEGHEDVAENHIRLCRRMREFRLSPSEDKESS